MNAWLHYLIAFVVACHGLTYAMFGFMVPGSLKEWTGASWLLGSALTADSLSRLIPTLHVAAGIVTIACAVAMGFAPYLPGWWRPLAIAGGLVGIASFAVFFDGQTQLVVQEGVIGAGVSVIILVGAIAFAEAFG